MITVKRILLIGLLVLIGFQDFIHAKNKKEIRGKLITVTYDTIEGYIKKIPDKHLNTHIQFRSMFDSEFVDLYPEQVEAFISDDFMLQSHMVNLNNVNRYIFIKRIYEGRLDLYYTRVENNSDIFIDSHEMYFVGFKDGRIIQLHKKYLIRTLKALFSGNECALEQIEADKFDYYYYKYSKLLHLFASYNCCDSPALVLKIKQKEDEALNP
jgi:hypothetical protein